MPRRPDWIALGGWTSRQVRLVFVYRDQQRALAVFETRSVPTSMHLAVFLQDAAEGWRLSAEGIDMPAEGCFGWSRDCVFGWGRSEPDDEVQVEYRGIDRAVRADAHGWWAFVHDVDPTAGDLVIPTLA